VLKSVADILEGAVTPGKKIGAKAKKSKDISKLTVGELNQRIHKVEDEMFAAAKDLQFELAAKLRDDLQMVKEQLIKNS